MELAYNFINGPYLIISLLGFVIISYVLVGLLTTSVIKPLKYLGIGVIITGIVCFGLKMILSLIISNIEGGAINILKIFINNTGTIFIKYAIICLVTGILMIALYIILSKNHKNDNNADTKTNETNNEPIEV